MPKTLKFESLRGNLEFKKILSAKKVSSDLFTIYYTNKDASLETNKIHMISHYFQWKITTFYDVKSHFSHYVSVKTA